MTVKCAGYYCCGICVTTKWVTLTRRSGLHTGEVAGCKIATPSGSAFCNHPTQVRAGGKSDRNLEPKWHEGPNLTPSHHPTHMQMLLVPLNIEMFATTITRACVELVACSLHATVHASPACTKTKARRKEPSQNKPITHAIQTAYKLICDCPMCWLILLRNFRDD